MVFSHTKAAKKVKKLKKKFPRKIAMMGVDGMDIPMGINFMLNYCYSSCGIHF